MDQDTPIAVALEEATGAFRLGDGRVYTAVEKAQLTVAQGEFVAIVGPTGCGKSTLLNVAAGLLQPAGGSAKIFGRPLAGLNRLVSHGLHYFIHAPAAHVVCVRLTRPQHSSVWVR